MGKAFAFVSSLLLCTACTSISPNVAQTEARTKASEISEAATNVPSVEQGDIPWWRELAPGIYEIGSERMIVAVGTSKEYRHMAEGFLDSKVSARLSVKSAFNRLRVAGGTPEPDLFDLFIGSDRRFFALYVIRVPKDAAKTELVRVDAPTEIHAPGRHHVGRHLFSGARHLYLECEVEGPIANPDWGRATAAARP